MFGINSTYDEDDEELRERLLDEIYAGAFAGMPAMLMDEPEIKKAKGDELDRIASRYGLSRESGKGGKKPW